MLFVTVCVIKLSTADLPTILIVKFSICCFQSYVLRLPSSRPTVVAWGELSFFCQRQFINTARNTTATSCYIWGFIHCDKHHSEWRKTPGYLRSTRGTKMERAHCAWFRSMACQARWRDTKGPYSVGHTICHCERTLIAATVSAHSRDPHIWEHFTETP